MPPIFYFEFTELDLSLTKYALRLIREREFSNGCRAASLKDDKNVARCQANLDAIDLFLERLPDFDNPDLVYDVRRYREKAYGLL